MSVGGYTVERLLGRGASAVVELARAADGRQVAIKRIALTGSAAEITRARRRIRREAEILGTVRHAGIVPLLDVIDDGVDVVIVMPYLPGGTLHDRVTTGGPLPAAEVARPAGVLLDGLAAAHRAGVVHRDITPANILLTAEGAPLLADFGVAAARHHTAGLTGGGGFGTPGFLSPEQARGEPATSASDVFGLAASLVFALRGSGPYGSGSPELLAWRAARGDLDPLPPGLPAPMARQLAAMLDPDPSRRPTAAAARGGPTGTQPTPVRVVAGLEVPGPVPVQTRIGGAGRRRALVAALLAGVVAAGGSAGVLLARAGNGRASATPSTTGQAKAAVAAAPDPAPPPCTPLPYQPCGQRSPAPFTDGSRCTGGHDDYDGDRVNGCEAVPDSVNGSELVAGTPIVANIVPADEIDTYRLRVTDRFQVLCDGSITVSLTAPAGVADRVEVLRDGRVLGSALSVEGRTATAHIDDPSCLRDDSGWLTVRVTSVAGHTATPYRLETSGHF